MELASNPRLIEGIYNYCDRWCERCPMTSRCLLFARENAEARDGGARDPDNEESWRAIAKNFAVTQRMILRDVQERGIDRAEPDSPERTFLSGADQSSCHGYKNWL